MEKRVVGDRGTGERGAMGEAVFGIFLILYWE